MQPIDRLNDALEGRYRVERELGEGGMATVYLARDQRHERKVAIKVLKPDLTAVLGAERFLAEIRTIASLQHPHILTLHDSGSVDSFLFYVMPYVEGESLREKLDREQQLPVREAVEIAVKVAGALNYAHDQGVVHRDIKPANILMSRGGEPLVADFGIALALSEAGGGRITETGLSLGTPHYMSPEQASGDRRLDARSDLYALGCVLFEMLTGEPPHAGPTAQAVLANVLTEDVPRARRLRRTVPPNVDASISRSLEKLPADRFGSAGAFIHALEDPGFRHETAAHGGGGDGPGRTWRSWVPWVLAAAAIAIALWAELFPVEDVPVSRTVRVPVDVTTVNSTGRRMVLSPDGSMIAYVGGGLTETHLYLRKLDELSPTPVPGTAGAYFPFFSDDGSWLAFTDGNRILKTRLSGGLPTSVIDDLVDFRGADWEGQSIVYSASGGLWEVGADGGEPTRLLAPDTAAGESALRWPAFVPGGEAVLYTVWSGAVENARVEAVAVGKGERRPVARGTDGRYSPSGHVMFGRTGQVVLAAPFDPERLEVTGQERTVLSGVLVKSGGAVEYELSPQGSLLYVSAAGVDAELVEMTRAGAVRVLTDRRGEYSWPNYSPEGSRIAVSRRMERGERDVWIYEFDDGTLRRITGSGDNVVPAWLPDGERLLVQRHSSLVVLSATGEHPARWVATLEVGGDLDHLAVTPDGGAVVYQRASVRDIWRGPVDGGDEPAPVVAGPARERAPALSADGSLLAFVSDQLGQDQVWVTDFPESTRRVRVSLEGGDQPRWSDDGRLFYRVGDTIAVAELRTQGDLDVSRRTMLFEIDALPGPRWDVHPGGERFVIVREVGERSLILVLNWLRELEGPGRSGSAGALMGPYSVGDG